MVDVASLVPSTRDFLQAIFTRKKRLILVPLVDRADDARALSAAGVTAFAVSAPGDAMREVSAAVGSIPLLSLAAVANENDVLLARAHGADAVVIDAAAGASSWGGIAKTVSSTRMATLAMVVDAASSVIAAKTTARGAYVKVDSIASIPRILAPMTSLRIVAHVPSADEKVLRALRGIVDAAVVESDLYLSTSFETLREEFDP